jgi:hypothetical protein
VSGGFDTVDTLKGGSSGTLTGEDLASSGASTWTLGATQTYNDGASNSLAFTGFGTLTGRGGQDAFNVNVSVAYNLNGGADNDTFAIANGKTLTGAIDGGTGSDTLDLSNFTSANPTNETLASSDGHGYNSTTSGNTAVSGGFKGIDTLKGGASGTLSGEDLSSSGNSTWTLDTTQTYSDNAGNGSLTFTGFGTLTGRGGKDAFNVNQNVTYDLNGGADNDTFAVANGKTLTGSITGGAGNDTVTVGNGSSISGSVSGGAGSDTLDLSANATTDATLTTSAADGYSGTSVTGVSGGFDTVDVLKGGSSGTLTGEDNGTTSTPDLWTLDSSSSTSTTYADQRSGSGSLAFTGFATLQGGSGADKFSVAGGTNASRTLKGGAGADTLFLNNNSDFSGAFDGQSGADTVDVSTAANALDFIFTGADSNGFTGSLDLISSTGTLAGVDNLVENPIPGESISFQGNSGDSAAWTIGTTGSLQITGGFTLTFTGASSLVGGNEDDTFTFNGLSNVATLGGSTSFSPTIDGGSGTNALVVNDTATAEQGHSYTAEGDSSSAILARNDGYALMLANIGAITIHTNGTGSFDSNGFGATLD